MKKLLLIFTLAALLLTACAAQPQTPPPTEDDSFTEVELFTNELYSATVVGVTPDGLLGYTLELRLANRSQENCVFSLDGLALNGLQVTAFMRVEVPAGLSAIQEVSVIEDPAQLGVPTPTDLTFALRVSGVDGTLRLPRTVVHYYPQGQEQAYTFARQPLETDTVVADTDAVTVIVTGYRNDRVTGYTAGLYLVNKTDADVMVNVSDAAVNGHAIDPYYATLIMGGTAFFDEISWNTADMEAAGIIAVEEITFTLSVSEFPGSTQYLNQQVTLSPEG